MVSCELYILIVYYMSELVGSRNGFERDFTIELKQTDGLLED